MFYADSQAFFALPAKPPVFGASRPLVGLALVTSAPPMLKALGPTLDAHHGFRKTVLANVNTHEVLTAKDLDLNPSGINVVFGLQHAPAALTLEGVHQLASAGIRSMALAYDDRSDYGDGYRGNGFITALGAKLLEWMATASIVLDLSHASVETSRDALDFIDRERLPLPVMASHSGCQKVFMHRRNMPDDVIERLGYIGIPAISFFLTKHPAAVMRAFVDHVSHAFTVCKRRTVVGIGSDCPHVDMTMEEARTMFDYMLKMLKTDGTLGEYFPDRPQQIIEHGSRMFEILKQEVAGIYSTQVTDGIVGHNLRSFLKRSLPQ